MTWQLPDIRIEYDRRNPQSRVDAVDAAIKTLDRHLLLTVRLSNSRPEVARTVTAQCFAQMRQIRLHSKQVKDKFQRKEFRRRLDRIEAAINHLHASTPRVKGSGALRVRSLTMPVRSVSSGGLPTLGKRR